MIATFEWTGFLRRWSRDLLRIGDAIEDLPANVIASGWMGYPGATEAQIGEVEAHLGTRLPPSYREFLTVTNGWRQTTPFIDRLWSTEEIEWLSVRNQELIDIWMEDPSPVSDEEYFNYGAGQRSEFLRSEYLQTALEISDWGDSAIYLLNPQVVTPAGEWEAWFFANWLPGATRHRSFWELMQDEYESFLRLRDDEA